MAVDKFTINLTDKPALHRIANTDVPRLREIIGTFVDLMEVAAQENWTDLPKAIHSTLSFHDIVFAVMESIMTTRKIEPKAYATLESDLHPLALISDQRKNVVTGETERYDWMAHFNMDTNEVSKESLTKIIRKMLYLMRWFDIESVSKALITREFPIMDAKDIYKLPFQPALQYQKENLGELYVGKFLHDIGAFNCGLVPENTVFCPACTVGELKPVTVKDTYLVCPRCNAGFEIESPLEL